MTTPPDELKDWVIAAAERPDVHAAVHALYAEIQTAIDRRRPLCVLSGRCCHFEEFGHRLFVTTAELAAFHADLSSITRPIPGPQALGCAFQSGKICRVHLIRPMGCRIFFCDSTAVEWQQDLYERSHAHLKQIHSTLSIPYVYTEWRQACTTMGWD